MEMKDEKADIAYSLLNIQLHDVNKCERNVSIFSWTSLVIAIVMSLHQEKCSL